MRARSLPWLLFVICTVLGSRSAAAQASGAEGIGKVQRLQGTVQARLSGKDLPNLKKKAKILEGTTVITLERAGVAILVGRRPAKHGLVQLGPNTRFAFERWVEEAVRGEWKTRLHAGQAFALFWPDTYSATGEHTVTIQTPTGLVRLHGTAVFLDVSPIDGRTFVYVQEGYVTVTSLSGGEVTVRAGQQTTVIPGQPPTEPVSMSPGAGPDLGAPGDAWLREPLAVDLSDPRLDLPK